MSKNTIAKVLVFILTLSIFSCSVYAVNGENSETENDFEIEEIFESEPEENNEKGEVRAIWVATVYGLDFLSSGGTTDSKIIKEEIIKMIENIDEMGFNTIYFQVRPSADAFYPSKIFPWSKYLTGDMTTGPDHGFDPLEFIITEAHKRNIELHPWINPYRVTVKYSDYDKLPDNHPARLHPEWVVKYGSGNSKKHYFDPGIPEVEKLILDGVSEILENYDVDGIHLDDYFYPGKSFNDYYTYKKYRGEVWDIYEWRRNNITNLIKKMYKLVKDKDENLKFGVSPFGIWANNTSKAEGSDTKGSESYYKMYADTRKWVKEGYLDYIIPQIYWNIGFEIADYEKLLNWWSDVVADTEVDLYVGQAAYRTGNSDKSSPWYGVEQIGKQVELNRITNNVQGYSMFSYGSFLKNPELVELIKELNKKSDNE
ncbi:glycoside hydrolase family 10 protein [Oceanirhabdus sp. W0125-5]|uniref:glycoside hydrolase family 10 protein n=1 Tax=Oceanirhabdus sp. W0125-5 TaxID=2999116 RepID=UPI0022F32750|nr:family 10 glycosylhydrolase [Oceanirhabdus sp. W0125-5]WBW97761.1 family 10 glycosylhydrolase [Oceanirhabdus sp. W0125-5]